MARKKGKSVSFDAMVKFFLNNYNIPTKKDIEKLMVRMDRLERLVQASARNRRGTAANGKAGRRRNSMTAFETVLEVIKNSKEGAGFADIKAETGFNDKKIRNIIFRLNKMGKIARKSRGVYVAS